MADSDLSAGDVAVVLTSMVAAVTMTLVTALAPLGFCGLTPPPMKPKKPLVTGVSPAKSAKDFTGSICVNAHWDYTNTPYYSDYATVKGALVDLHITCDRSSYRPGVAWYTARLNDLAASGIKHTVILDDELFNATAADRAEADLNSDGTVSTAEAVTRLMDTMPNIIALEGPNEELWDAGQCAATLQLAQETWAAKQADSRYNGIPFIGPSAAWPTQYSCLGDISGITDGGNAHPYPGDLPPSATIAGANWSAAGWLRNTRLAVGSTAPVWATETGYNTAINATDPGPGLSEAADGKYMSQIYFALQRIGYTKVFKYELLDEFDNPALDDDQSHYGMLRYDLTQKPSYVTLNRIMDLLDDSGQANLTPLDYTVTGTPSTFRSYLLQKTDGSHWLAMWNDIKVWDGTTGTDLTPADVTVTLSLTSRKTVDVYRPYSSASPVSSSTGTTVEVAINADVALVKIQ